LGPLPGRGECSPDDSKGVGKALNWSQTGRNDSSTTDFGCFLSTAIISSRLICAGFRRRFGEPDQPDERSRSEHKIEWAPEQSRRGTSEIELGRAQRFVFVRRIDESESSYFVWEKPGIHPRIQTTERSAGKYAWRRHTCMFQERMKIPGDGRTGSRKGTGVAPAYTGSVIPAGLYELGNFRLKGTQLRLGPSPSDSKMTGGAPVPEQKMLRVRPPISTDLPICGSCRRSRLRPSCSYWYKDPKELAFDSSVD
jgi:hypothetical protein